jgi:hypothetical protein
MDEDNDGKFPDGCAYDVARDFGSTSVAPGPGCLES